VKPAYQQAIDPLTLKQTLGYFEQLLALLHPFMPFITEELWQSIQDRAAGESLMVSRQLDVAAYDEHVIERFETTKGIIAAIRTIRLEKNLPNKEALTLQLLGNHDAGNDAALLKMAHLNQLDTSGNKTPGAISFMVGTTEYAVPLAEYIDINEEISKMEAEITYLEGFLVSVMNKLNNERFVSNAKPEVVEAERKKKADAETKICSLKENVAALKKA
jgi:valyl-tRNA synthetase